MIKKLKSLATLSAVLLGGCGGSANSNNADSTTAMSYKQHILILRNTPSDLCERDDFRDELSKKLIGVLTKERPNTISCSDYGRSNDKRECEIAPYSDNPEDGNVSCVVGSNGEIFSKQANPITTYTHDIVDIMTTLMDANS